MIYSLQNVQYHDTDQNQSTSYQYEVYCLIKPLQKEDEMRIIIKLVISYHL